MNNKGQIFLIIAVITIIIIVLIKTSMSLVDVIENKRSLEAGLERLEFRNVRNEMERTIQITYNQSNTTANTEKYFNSAKNFTSSAGYELTGFFVETAHPKINGSDQRFNVSALNLLGEEIINLDFEFNGDTANFTYVAESSRAETNFTINTGTDVNYTLSVHYKTPTVEDTEGMLIQVEMGESKFIGFYDLRLETDKTKNQDKFVKTVELP